MSTKQNLFARYMVVKQLIALPFEISHDPLTGSSTGGDDMFNSVTIGDTYLLNPTRHESDRLYMPGERKKHQALESGTVNPLAILQTHATHVRHNYLPSLGGPEVNVSIL